MVSGLKQFFDSFTQNSTKRFKKLKFAITSEESASEKENSDDSLNECDVPCDGRRNFSFGSCNLCFLARSSEGSTYTKSCNLSADEPAMDYCNSVSLFHQDCAIASNVDSDFPILGNNTNHFKSLGGIKRKCPSDEEQESSSSVLCFTEPMWRISNRSSVFRVMRNNGMAHTVLKDPFSLTFKCRLPVVSSCSVFGDGAFHCASCRRPLRTCRLKQPSILTEEPCSAKKFPFPAVKFPTKSRETFITDYAPSDYDESGEESNELPGKGGYYTVERFLAEREIKKSGTRTKYYYIKWANWSHRYDSWEPERNLGNVEIAMRKFRARETALRCIARKKNVNSGLRHLRQLRNLDRWEKEMNDKLLATNQRMLYIYNEVNYAMKPKNFTYVTTNILPKHMKSYLVKSGGHFCNCSTEACGKSSKCCPELEKHRKFYTTNSKLKKEYNKDQGLIVECNSNCSCSLRCPTRVVQRGRHHLVAVAQTVQCGWGVFALEKIQANRFVVEYVGEVLSTDEARKRRDPHYQFEIDEDGKVSYVIDAKYFGNESAFVNHSCDPNLVAIPIYVERTIPGYHRIGFFTLRDIERGEELTLDYFNNPSEESSYIRDEDGIKCCCGAKCCKGFFPQVVTNELSPGKSGCIEE